MGDVDREQTIQRILVALDTSPSSLAALQVAADLAQRLDAKLVGLFVEDIDLIRLSELSLAKEITIYTKKPRQVDREEMQQRLRSRARMARRAVAEVARQAGLDWDFQVATGRVAKELLKAAEETDLLLIGKAGWSRRRRMGSTARIIVSRSPRMALVIQEGGYVGVPVGVVYDGTPLARKALVAAADLVRFQDGYLVVFISASDSDQARQYQSEISSWVQEHGLHAHYRWMLEGKLDKLIELIQSESCGAVVLPGETKALDDEERAKLVDYMECPVLLVR